MQHVSFSSCFNVNRFYKIIFDFSLVNITFLCMGVSDAFEASLKWMCDEVLLLTNGH